jgi:hypothetical protein
VPKAHNKNDGRDHSLDGCIRITAFAKSATFPLGRVEAALRTLNEIVKMEVVTAKDSIRPQVHVWVRGSARGLKRPRVMITDC